MYHTSSKGSQSEVNLHVHRTHHAPVPSKPKAAPPRPIVEVDAEAKVQKKNRNSVSYDRPQNDPQTSPNMRRVERSDSSLSTSKVAMSSLWL